MLFSSFLLVTSVTFWFLSGVFFKVSLSLNFWDTQSLPALSSSGWFWGRRKLCSALFWRRKLSDLFCPPFASLLWFRWWSRVLTCIPRQFGTPMPGDEMHFVDSAGGIFRFWSGFSLRCFCAYTLQLRRSAELVWLDWRVKGSERETGFVSIRPEVESVLDGLESAIRFYGENSMGSGPLWSGVASVM